MSTILVVDDNRESANLLSEFLRMLGHQADTAYCGEDALRSAQKIEPNVVVLDLGLPDISGLDVCRRLRAMAGPVRPTLVAMTGWVQIAERQAAEAAGFDFFLPKPADLNDLLEILGPPSKSC